LDCCDNNSLQSTLNRIQANVRWALGTIPAYSEQLKAHSHGPRATIIREAQAMTDVGHAVPIRNEVLDILAVALACGILENMAGLIVGEQDGPRLINHDRGVRRVREDTLQGSRGNALIRAPIDEPNQGDVLRGRPRTEVRRHTYCELTAAAPTNYDHYANPCLGAPLRGQS
jgi:hypothetical protein